MSVVGVRILDFRVSFVFVFARSFVPLCDKVLVDVQF